MAAFKWPITALSSILHRMSGVLLFIAVPFALWMLEQSLESQTSYEQLQHLLSGGLAKFIIWLVLAALSYHCWPELQQGLCLQMTYPLPDLALQS